MKYLLASLLLCCGCPDVGGECKKVLDREREVIAKEIGEQCGLQIVQAVGLFFDVRLAMYGCGHTDGGLWDCTNTLLCGTCAANTCECESGR